MPLERMFFVSHQAINSPIEFEMKILEVKRKKEILLMIAVIYDYCQK